MPARYSSIWASWFLRRGRLAEQAQNHLASGFDGLLALAHLALQTLALLVDFQHARARLGDLVLEPIDGLFVRGDFGFEPIEPDAKLLGFLLGLGDALLDGAALLAPATSRRAAGALGFHIQSGELLARLGELLLQFVADGLRALMRLFALAPPAR